VIRPAGDVGFTEDRDGLHAPFTAEVEVPLPTAREDATRLPQGERHQRASTNIRRHLVRAGFRVAVLVVADLAAYAALRLLLNVVRDRPLLGSGVLDVVNSFLHKGFLGGWSFAVALVVALAATGNYGKGDRRRDPSRLFLACIIGVGLVLWTPLWERPLLVASQYMVTVAMLGLTLSCARIVLDVLSRRLRPFRSVAARTLLVGSGGDCIGMLGRTAMTGKSGFNVVGFVDTNDPPCGTATGRFHQLDALLHELNVDTVVFCGPASEATFARVVKTVMAAECRLLTAARTFELAGVRPSVVWRRGQPFIELREVALRGQQLILKRLLDMICSGVALLLLSPLMVLIAIAVRLESRGPAVFGQARLGRHGRVFRCYKFRSMHPNAEQILREDPELYALYVKNDFKLPEAIDTRITRIGRFLRRTSLDELPQLWNVFRGDMSLVGPRPIVVEELRHYDEEEPLFLSLKPGITGAWQVNGRSSMAYPARASLELEYVQTWSLRKDLGILARTLPAVLTQRGAH
jgi:exopolysaccharide biosynthesis polyprenyl glycosylphosphotransferase